MERSYFEVNVVDWGLVGTECTLNEVAALGCPIRESLTQINELKIEWDLLQVECLTPTESIPLVMALFVSRV